ncbi:DUF3265 domain-containing protein [Vibrio alginolyticus]|nr:DUF3265 domain-containing protein [Vibrio alginolyticus]
MLCGGLVIACFTP